MDIFTTLAAFIIFIGLLFHIIRTLAVVSGYLPDEGVTEHNADVPSMPNNGSASSPADDQNDHKGLAFDVFLSFRGEDTRKRFVSHLYNALKRSSMNPFMDSRDLGKGKPIETLLKSVRESRILLPIFSKRFAESVWCLKEITEMVKVMKTGKNVDIIPIFFDVEPEDVRSWYRNAQWPFERRGIVASAGEKKKWRKALRKVAGIHGLTLNNNAHGDEAELVELIVVEVQTKLNKIPLHVADYPIGMKSRVQEVRTLLKNEGQAVNMIGLQGMPGIGKTTIATAVYNELSHNFDGACSFISDVAEKFRKGEGVKCQEQLINNIKSKEDRCSIGSIHAGINKIKETTGCRKVLIVLDDVDSIEQLRALAGGRDWFGPGSVIIITSKYEDLLLKQELEESQIYKPKLLNEEESIQFLVRHVFKGRQPTKKELDMSREIAKVADGLPLALEVLGPHLSSKRNTEEWRHGQVEKLKGIPVKDVERKLKISLDELEDEEKEIFLDIACFFVGADCGRVIHYYWEACRFDSKPIVKLLQDRSLISVDKEYRLHMHGLIRNMGREFVLRRSQVPASWEMDRLWTSNDIFDLLQRDEVPTCNVTGIMLSKGVEEGKELRNSFECFRNMHRLRLLHMEGVNFKNNFRFPSELLWLGLPRCSFESPPSGLNLQKLAILNLSNCNLANLSFFRDKVFVGLKFLDLSSTDLTTTPNFCNFPRLVELTFRQCEKLTEVHSSIGVLKSLVTLDMRTCTSLKELPDTICNLRSIEALHLGWCEKLSSLPKQIGDLTSLKELSLNNTGIRRIPDSVAQLTSLCELPLQRCKWLEPLPDSLAGWFSLGKLKIFGTPLKMIEEGIDLSDRPQVLRVTSCKVLAFLPDESYKAVTEFYLTDPMVQEFPHSIRRLQNLVILSLTCEKLTALPAWINGGQLEKIKELVIESKSLEIIPESIGSLKGLKTLKLVCENLSSLPNSVELKSLEIFEVASGNLEQLPLWIGSLRSLRQLIVECTRIKAIPKSIKQLEELEVLKLHLDNPNALLDSTKLPKKLKKFSLSCKDLKNLPDCVWSLGELEELSLRGCSIIEDFPDAKLGQLRNLLHLDLSQTRVKKMPENICCLPKLLSLQITDVGNGTTFWFE